MGYTHHHGHHHHIPDTAVLATKDGIRTVKYSFCILAITACIQLYIYSISGSMALLADTIHNVADACTSLPLWVAFLFSHKKPSQRFTYGYGRMEDFAGMIIVLIIIGSASAIGYKSIERLINPETIAHIPAVIVAAIIGFIGNEAVARYRLRTGKRIQSAALVADGHHARIDSFTSLAVLIGALGSWINVPALDALVGIGIVFVLCKIVWSASIEIFSRLLDGTDPAIVKTITQTVGQLQLIHSVDNVRARWIGHRLYAEVDITMNDTFSIAATHAMEHTAESLLKTVLPSLDRVLFHFHPLLHQKENCV
ncbi:MAG: cation efflux family protein [Parcubacteria group bacterium Gr01-1014_48]|nr:MAG: cation efflux family protein [Parcubacteria group bacterium Greene0416_14]TSC73622.1 MAG: cation efflux family protein [Parcubacteria group bacterium Gr01-1014_48]TSD00900.1 MAG: cation efflux family protein [Parcubacteria group bacterium Greene1014_15]TSD07982.1 MAG: cation efflux family protein [Parcubacteria group bacterium Greene0714_4]